MIKSYDKLGLTDLAEQHREGLRDQLPAGQPTDCAEEKLVEGLVRRAASGDNRW